MSKWGAGAQTAEGDEGREGGGRDDAEGSGCGVRTPCAVTRHDVLMFLNLFGTSTVVSPVSVGIGVSSCAGSGVGGRRALDA